MVPVAALLHAGPDGGRAGYMVNRTWADAEIVAQRMNARVLPDGCDGGHWDAAKVAGRSSDCDTCGKPAGIGVACDIGGGVLLLCLDCALLDCMGVRS